MQLPFDARRQKPALTKIFGALYYPLFVSNHILLVPKLVVLDRFDWRLKDSQINGGSDLVLKSNKWGDGGGFIKASKTIRNTFIW